MFIDRVKVEVQAGSGGNGLVAWRREKYIPKGGPYGGDGGKGGSVIFYVDPNVYALDWFKHTRILKAPNGDQGGAACRKGRDGKDLIVNIPLGTLIKDTNSGEILFDATEAHQQFVLCRGGKGGKGNFHFRSPTNQAPSISTPGLSGEHCFIELELKLIADVGLVGFPNAGKSTLLSKLSHRTNILIGAYPFTTLAPNLGFVSFKGDTRILMADIPGIIEGAHLDRGLGLEFLRHIERTKMLVYVIDISGFDGRDPEEDFLTLQNELSSYDPELLKRKSLVVLNKLDIEGAEEKKDRFLARFSSHPIVSISCEADEGIDEVKQKIRELFFQEPVQPR